MEGGKASPGTKYIKFVKKWHKMPEHKKFTWRQAMKKASKDYHKKHGGEIHSSSYPSADRVRSMAMDAVSHGHHGSGEGYWFGDSKRHRKAAKKGWKTRRANGGSGEGYWFGDPKGHKKAAKKGWKKRRGGGEAEPIEVYKMLAKQHALMGDMLASGVLAGSGFGTKAKRHRTHMKKLMKGKRRLH